MIQGASLNKLFYLLCAFLISICIAVVVTVVSAEERRFSMDTVTRSMSISLSNNQDAKVLITVDIKNTKQAEKLFWSGLIKDLSDLAKKYKADVNVNIQFPAVVVKHDTETK